MSASTVVVGHFSLYKVPNKAVITIMAQPQSPESKCFMPSYWGGKDPSHESNDPSHESTDAQAFPGQKVALLGHYEVKESVAAFSRAMENFAAGRGLQTVLNYRPGDTVRSRELPEGSLVVLEQETLTRRVPADPESVQGIAWPSSEYVPISRPFTDYWRSQTGKGKRFGSEMFYEEASGGNLFYVRALRWGVAVRFRKATRVVAFGFNGPRLVDGQLDMSEVNGECKIALPLLVGEISMQRRERNDATYSTLSRLASVEVAYIPPPSGLKAEA